MSNILCITGMHRSGTSLVAGWLEQCGLTIHGGQLIGPSVGNPRGHFEDREFMELQSAAIEAREPGSFGWRVRGGDFFNFTDEESEKANWLVTQRAALPSWGWKDPRSVVFLPAWQKLAPDLKVLLVWRPCEEVVTSLLKRSGKGVREDHIELFEAAEFWLGYAQRMVSYHAEHAADTVVLAMDDIIHRDRDVLDCLNTKLGLDLRYTPLSGVYDASLYHSAVSLAARVACNQRKAVEAHEQLRAASDLKPAAKPGAVKASPAKVTPEALLATIEELARDLYDRDGRVHQLLAEREWQKCNTEQQQNSLLSQQQTIHSQQQSIQSLQLQLQAQDQKLHDQRRTSAQEVQAKDQEILERQQAIDSQRQILDERQSVIKTLQQQLAKLQTVLDAQQVLTRNLEQAVEQAKEQLAEARAVVDLQTAELDTQQARARNLEQAVQCAEQQSAAAQELIIRQAREVGKLKAELAEIGRQRSPNPNQ